jgi:hypothetical protein
MIPFLTNKNSQSGVKLQTNRLRIKNAIYGRPRVAPGPETVAAQELRLSNHHGILHGNTRMPYDYLIEVSGEFCIEI